MGNKREIGIRDAKSICSCHGCGETFDSVESFSKHRVGLVKDVDRRCLTSREMLNHGMEIGEDGIWRSGIPTSPTPAGSHRAQREEPLDLIDIEDLI